MTAKKKVARKRKLPASMAAAAESKNPDVTEHAGAAAHQTPSRSNKTSHDGLYEVGYRKPPKETRFKPGQSGNPKGRPREALNRKTRLEKAALEKIAVTENGRTRKLSKIDVIEKTLMNKAAAGDKQATKIVFDQMARYGALDDDLGTSKSERTSLSAADQAIFDMFSSMLDEANAPNNTDDES